MSSPRPTLEGTAAPEDLAAREPVRDEHDVARTFTRRAIGDAQVPVQRVARLREHCGSVSRGAGRVSVSCNQLKQSVLHAFVRFDADSPGTARGVTPGRQEASQGEDQELAEAVAVTAITFGVAASTVVPASAVDNVKPFGQQERLNDWGTGSSNDRLHGHGAESKFRRRAHNGQLYEAAVTIDAFGSSATPLIAQFNARAENGQNYRSSPMQASEARCRRAAARPASSISMSWATCPTASSTTTAFGTFSLGCPVSPGRYTPLAVAAPRLQ